MQKIKLFFLFFVVTVIGCSEKPTPQSKHLADPKAIAESYVAEEAKKENNCEVKYRHQANGAIGDPKIDGIALIYTTGECKGGGNAFVNTLVVLEVKDGKANLVSEVHLASTEVSSVKSIAINSEGYLQLDVLTYGPNDPSCCPTTNKTIKFSLVNRTLTRLVEVGAENSPRQAPADVKRMQNDSPNNNKPKLIETKNKGSVLGSCRSVYNYAPIYTNGIYMRLISSPTKSDDERWANEQKAKQLQSMVKRGERRADYIYRKTSDLVPPSEMGDYFSAESNVGAELSQGHVNPQLVLQAFDYCDGVPLN